MFGTNKLLKNTSPYAFIIKFLVLFFLLNELFDLYWGIVGKGGKMYSPFISNNLNLIYGFTSFLTYAAKLLLQAFGYDAFLKQFNVLRIGFSKGVIVNPSCLGWSVISFWIAFIVANAGNLKHKLKWLIFGIASITILNVFRIALIALANHRHWATLSHLNHHQTFNIVSYCCIFILMFWYIRAQKKYERFNTQNRSKGGELSVVR